MANLFVEQAKSRKFFYRNVYRKELILLIVFNVLACVWIALIVSVAIGHLRTVPYFYASSSNGILTPLKPMPLPNRLSTAMLE